MKISTFNVNSVNARLDNLLNWLNKTNSDVVLLQEIKSEFNSFPFFEISAAGYDAKILGQKSYNGVAILSKHKIEITQEGLPFIEDENSRYLEAVINGIRFASIYLPNGNPPYNAPDDNSKFEYKLKWMEALYKHAQNLLSKNEPIVFGGDFNVILTDDDVYDPKLFANNALSREEVRQRFTALTYLGLYDSFRALHPKDIGYTFWDYAGNSFNADFGMRIDYFLLSAHLVDKLKSCEVDKSPRQAPKPSDHTALTIELEP